jgi:hypothetical protein
MRQYKICAVAFLSLLTLAARAADHATVLIIYDMEGASGVVSAAQVLDTKPEEYALGRKSLTSDVNAAVRGLVAGGAGKILIQDAHGNINATEPDVLMNELDSHASFDFRSTEYFRTRLASLPRWTRSFVLLCTRVLRPLDSYHTPLRPGWRFA